MRLIKLTLAVAVAAIGVFHEICAVESPVYGPTHGTVLIIGGGSDRGAGLIETFLNRAGGINAKVVIIPTANGNRTPDGQLKSYDEDEVLAIWKSRGLKNVCMLHTPDRKVADTEEFVRPLRNADAVWFDGDKPQDLLDSYLNTRTHREFVKLLERGGVIGANSAGAACLGSYLARGPNADTNAIMLPEQQREAGFGLLHNSIIDLQVNTQNRWDDLIPVIKMHPDLLGLGLSESTAIVVSGNRLEVVGKWKVAVHDRTRAYPPGEKPYYLLSAGDVFNLQTRLIEKLGNGTQVAPAVNPVASVSPTNRESVTPEPPKIVITNAPEYGPARGTLVLVGGGSARGTGIMEKFVNLAGGGDAKIVVVPTANGNRDTNGQVIVYKEEEVLAPWKRQLRLKNVRMLHTYDPKIANTEEFVQPLREANAVWFDGGRQWNLVDSYKNTLTEEEFHKVLERGGVIGGTSSGATIQGDYLVRGAVAGPEIVMAPEPEHQHGFGFLHRSAVDQHVNTRNRWDDLTPVIQKYPALLGIGLSEGTAIIVTGDRFEVMGKWKVAIHDNTRLYQPWEKTYDVLEAGDVFNMKTRSVEKYGDQPQPVVLIKRDP